ncbi:hypothetical protein CHS0354_030458 [Potamilus streckersoni]|uniref:Uncharacterized protein n=1 Tax=Potamilus streckersoni TaxID=2493646 RepID=A0AAE0T1P8_9BIVA|nr:hypothetical protein CHS0354_030458 [Potamilus streckersoni]
MVFKLYENTDRAIPACEGHENFRLNRAWLRRCVYSDTTLAGMVPPVFICLTLEPIGIRILQQPNLLPQGHSIYSLRSKRDNLIAGRCST